jgi:hypothetical protein
LCDVPLPFTSFNNFDKTFFFSFCLFFITNDI